MRYLWIVWDVAGTSKYLPATLVAAGRGGAVPEWAAPLAILGCRPAWWKVAG